MLVALSIIWEINCYPQENRAYKDVNFKKMPNSPLKMPIYTSYEIRCPVGKVRNTRGRCVAIWE